MYTLGQILWIFIGHYTSKKTYITAGLNAESQIQILVNLKLWIGTSGFEPVIGSSGTSLQRIKLGHVPIK